MEGLIMDKREDFKKSYFDGFSKLTGVRVDDFMRYYDEAKYGGYPEEAGGSVWESEGKSIYVLIRILKPKRILEFGSWVGVASNHILQAVEKNGVGEVVLLDIEEHLNYERLHNTNFERVIDNSLNYLAKPFSFDLIIQDSDHHKEHVAKEIDFILANNQMENYYVWAHDYFTRHKPNECCVWEAWDERVDKFSDFQSFLDSKSDCGCSIAKK